jgi:hypothetical protein
MHVFLLLLFAALAIKAAVDPAPPPAGARAALAEAKREVREIQSLINRTRPEEAWTSLMADPGRVPSQLESKARFPGGEIGGARDFLAGCCFQDRGQ